MASRHAMNDSSRWSLLSLANIFRLAIIGPLVWISGILDAQQDRPIKVFILAGQSNMVGHGVIAADPQRFGGAGSLEFCAKQSPESQRYRILLDDQGNWRVRDDVWIHFLDRRVGNLTVGFGASEQHIGPELGFGIVVGEFYSEPILLIKLAWGGKSLAKDFRPPSAGGATGDHYRKIIEGTQIVLNKLKDDIPQLGGRPYELAGFGWHQGWNDRINSDFVNEYRRNMIHFIGDIRRDLGVPKLPFVIAETGMGGYGETNPRALKLMEAQREVAEVAEFQDNVAFVETRGFWREKDRSPGDQDYHWNNSAETYYLIGEAMGRAMLDLCRRREESRAGSAPETAKSSFKAPDPTEHRPQPGAAPPATSPTRQVPSAPQELDDQWNLIEAELDGYLLVPHRPVDRDFNAGFSMYVAAWPLLRDYPGQRFQSGLFGTWMFAQHEGKPPENAYSDIEGGLGWWRDTRFATETPKLIMGGVSLNFVEWANGPGAGKGRDWNNPTGLYAVAQLSPRILWPPDGLNLKQGTAGELVGYGYLPLPLAQAKQETAGTDIPTGDRCWTLFLNTANFKGPVTFFLPFFWSKQTLDKRELAGQFLDARPSEPNKAIQMETQYVPGYVAKTKEGQAYARIAPVQFPWLGSGDAPLIHQVTAYHPDALWNPVLAWFAGGPVADSRIAPEAAAVHQFESNGGATWRIGFEGKKNKYPIQWNSFALPVAIDDATYGYRWLAPAQHHGRLATLPEYYRLDQSGHGKPKWRAVAADEVPLETGLRDIKFPRRRTEEPEPYVTPEEPASCWKIPGPAAGPFEAKLGDGSVVTYHWYRFADQPALLNADLTAEERETMQRHVELLHKHWTSRMEYLPAPTRGTLAELDPALLVDPPPGLEIGYVPIVTRQELRK